MRNEKVSQHIILVVLLSLTTACSFTPFIPDNATPDVDKGVILASVNLTQDSIGKLTSLIIKNTKTDKKYELLFSVFDSQSSLEIKPGEYVIESFAMKEYLKGFVPTDSIADTFNVPFNVEAGKIYYLGHYEAHISASGGGSAGAPPTVVSYSNPMTGSSSQGIVGMGGGDNTTWAAKLNSVTINSGLGEYSFKKTHLKFKNLEVVSPFSHIEKSSNSNVEFSVNEEFGPNIIRATQSAILSVAPNYEQTIKELDRDIPKFKDDRDVYMLYLLRATAKLGIGKTDGAVDDLVLASKKVGKLQQINNEQHLNKMPPETRKKQSEVNQRASQLYTPSFKPNFQLFKESSSELFELINNLYMKGTGEDLRVVFDSDLAIKTNSQKEIQRLIKSEYFVVRWSAALNPNISKDLLKNMLNDTSDDVASAARRRLDLMEGN